MDDFRCFLFSIFWLHFNLTINALKRSFCNLMKVKSLASLLICTNLENRIWCKSQIGQEAERQTRRNYAHILITVGNKHTIYALNEQSGS